MNRRFISLFLVLVGFAFSHLAQAAYDFTNIDPPTATYTQAWGINNSGQVVVGATIGAVDVNLLFDSKKGSFTTLPPYADADYTGLLGINESGVMVGSSFDETTGLDSGLIRSTKGVYTSFSHPDCYNTLGRGVSTKGLVSGYAQGCIASGYVGFIYEPASGNFVDFLPSLQTIAQGINSRGQVVGSVRYPNPSTEPPCNSGNHCTYGFLRESNGAVTLFRVNSQSTRARGITDSGRIVGFFTDADGFNRGFVGSLAGLPASGQNIPDVELLDVPSDWAQPGYVVISTFAQGINNAGIVVGGWIECPDAVVDVSLLDCDLPGNSRSHGFIATPEPPKKK